MDEYLSEVKRLWASDERKWAVSFRSPLEVWADNPSFLLLEVVTYVWAFLLYKHGNLCHVGVAPRSSFTIHVS